MFTFREMLNKPYQDRPGRSQRNRTVTSPPPSLINMMPVMTGLDLPVAPPPMGLPPPPLTPALTMWTTGHTPGDTEPSDGTLTTPSSWDPDTGGGDKPQASWRMISKSSPPGLLRLPEEGYKRKMI